MGDEQKNDDLTDDEIEIAIVNPRKLETEAISDMAREIQRRRAANRDMDAIKARLVNEIESTPEIREALTREMATYRLMANLGMRELRWDEQAITQVVEKLSPAARAAYERLERACAASEGFAAAWRRLIRNRLGLTTERLRGAIAEERDLALELAEATREHYAMAYPEIVQLIEGKERAFQVALAKEKAAPLGEGKL